MSKKTVSVHDVAAYILKRMGPMSTMKLQKLVYYSQAWSMVWDNRPIFQEPVQAWTHGPVVPALFVAHKGKRYISAQEASGSESALTKDMQETIDAVLQSYGHHDGLSLSELSHSEKPWLEARDGLAESDSSTNEISLQSLRNFYSSL